MWRQFGVSENNPLCEDVADDGRRLYFVSDFPHLIKNLWTWIVSQKEIETPDGTIRLRDWESVIKIDSQKAIKCCPELNSAHISPKPYEKMSVSRAYQFFSLKASTAMAFYRGKHNELSQSESTEKFIIRVANLIHAFDSRTGVSAIRKDETPEKKAIKEFLDYLDKSTSSKKYVPKKIRKKRATKVANTEKKKTEAKNTDKKKTNEKKPKEVSSSTSRKRQVSKDSFKCNNRDNILLPSNSATFSENVSQTESCFNIPDDIVINSNGNVVYIPDVKPCTNVKASTNKISDENPNRLCNRIASDSTIVGLRVTCTVALALSNFLINVCGYTFVMLTRMNQDNLEKFFGMVRSHGGCNDHPDPQAFLLIYRLMSLYSLIKPTGSNVTGEELFESLLKDCDTSAVSEKLEKWKILRERVITNIEQQCYLDENFDENTACEKSEEDKHLLQFFGGYIAMKAIAFKCCEICAASLIQSGDDFAGSLIDIRNYYNVLHYPSKPLYDFVSLLEDAVQSEINCHSISSLSPDTFLNVAEKVTQTSCRLPILGCSEHRSDVLSYIIHFFLILRMQFICKEYNENIKDVKKPREMRKMGKVVQGNE